MATKTEITAFIKLLGRLAVNEANNRIAAGKGFVLPSVCIAQSAIETGWGTAGIMVKANAFFGIKAGGSWTGKVYRADTWEVADGSAYNTTANFRAYDSLEASVKDYYDLIGNSSRYSKALSFGTDKGAWLTPKACITAIWAGGYATDTLYVEKIMNTITTRDLTTYDNLVDGEGTTIENLVDYTFTYDDLLSGAIITTDSGRSWANETLVGGSNPGIYSLDIEKAVTLAYEATFTIQIPDFLGLIIHTLYDDLVDLRLHTTYVNGDTITIPAGYTFAFRIIERNDNNFISPAEIMNEKIVFKAPYSLPTGDEIATSVIAHFVKIQ